jgi:hypothetical protein
VIVDLPEIEPLGRLSAYALLGLVQLMEPDTEELMQERAAASLIEDEYDSPHARAWYLSFHGSEFPGEPADACERYLLYRMMNIPRTEPMPPWVTTTGTVGKAGELDIARAWYEGGRMLGVPEGMEGEVAWGRLPPRLLGDDGEPLPIRQLGFEVASAWLTASTDLPVLKKGWRKPYICELKGKADEVVEEMMTGRRKDGTMAPKLRGPDPAHVRQLRATIGAARRMDWGSVAVCEHCWRIAGWSLFPQLFNIEPGLLAPGEPMPAPWSDAFYFCPWCGTYDPVFFDLEPPDCGEIYYWSRSWPRKTKSFFVEHDEAYFQRGLEVLRSAREHYIADELPPRPPHFQWSSGPCASCTHKPHCRLDAGLLPRKRKPDTSIVRSTLTGSNATLYARMVRPSYDPEKIRATVMERWSDE